MASIPTDLLMGMNRTQLLDHPALLPPPGVQPNFDNPPNNNAVVYAVTSICLLLTTLSVAVRAHSALWLKRKVRTEDLLVFAAFGLFVGHVYCVYHIAQVAGFGVHQWDIRVRVFIDLAYTKLVATLLYSVIIGCVKTAILLEWKRIFVPLPVRNGLYWACWTAIVLNGAYYASTIVTQNKSCSAHQSAWDKAIQGDHCVFSDPSMELTSAIINLISDVTILVLPQQVIWRLHMSARKKVAFSLTFAIGIFGCVTAAMRTYYTLKFTGVEDLTYNVHHMALWGVGEATSAFGIACVPVASRAAVKFIAWLGPKHDKKQVKNKKGKGLFNDEKLKLPIDVNVAVIGSSHLQRDGGDLEAGKDGKLHRLNRPRYELDSLFFSTVVAEEEDAEGEGEGEGEGGGTPAPAPAPATVISPSEPDDLEKPQEAHLPSPSRIVTTMTNMSRTCVGDSGSSSVDDLEKNLPASGM